MRHILFMVIVAWIIQQGIQVFHQISASAEQHSDTLYYLVLTGDQDEIERICTFGDCQQGFPSRIDALNGFSTILGLANGIHIVPIPPPPG